MPPRQELAQSYEEALALGFDPLEAAALETDLLLAQEDSSSQLPEIALLPPVRGVESPAQTKIGAATLATSGPAAQEVEAPMQKRTVSHAARRRGYTEDQAA